MIFKLLLIIAVISIVYFLFIKKKPKVTNTTNKQSKANKDVDVDEMVICETCGVYVALDETILSGSKYYCSQECLEKAK
jgi:uncharacterized protein